MRGLSPVDKTTMCDDLWMPCSPGAPGAVEMSMMDVASDKLYEPDITKVGIFS